MDCLAQQTAPGANSALFAAYLKESRSVRRVMLMVHTALRIGCQDGADAIDERHIDAALTYDERGSR